MEWGFRFYQFFLWSSLAFGHARTPLLINGTVVTDNSWNMVVNIASSKPDNCTGTVVGPRVVIANASCFMSDSTATFSVNGTSYTAKMTLSPSYPAQLDDIALGLTNQDITGVVPASIGGTASTGIGITMLGYGCSQDPGSNPPSFDGKLRVGSTTVTGIVSGGVAGTDNIYMVTGNGTGTSNSALICFRDDGGPAFIGTGAKQLVAINTVGDRKTENYSVRLDIPVSTTFIQKFISDNNGVEICGINGTPAHCQNGPPPPPSTCSLTANPTTVQSGQSVTLTLATQNATSATINGSPANAAGDTKVITTSATGSFTVPATVNGPGGPGNCSATYTVTSGPAQAATCALAASPTQVQSGQNVTLTLTTQNATSATINGAPANAAGDTKVIPTSATGVFTPQANVNGPGGPGSCSATYTVTSPSGNAPTCTVSATPQDVVIGQQVTLALSVTSAPLTATSATINGVAVAIPQGTEVVTPTDKGDVSVKGFVLGPNGSSNCYAWYHVDDNGGNPNVPNFAVIEQYCGSNTATSSKVQQVCIGVVKRDSTLGDLRINQAVQITYNDGTGEVMPLLDQIATPTPTQFDLKLFANIIVVADTYQVLDMRDATLTTDTSTKAVKGGISGPNGTYTVPTSIQGRSATGEFFNVTQLNAVGTTF